MFRKTLFLILISLVALNLQFCQKDSTDEIPAPTPEPEPEEIQSVCIWDGAALRDQPSRNGKWLSTVALGEQVLWLGISKVDSSDKNREYYKIRLSDGKEGWSTSYVIIADSKPAVITNKMFVYRRPDLLTMTDVTFDSKEMLAIIKTDSDWFEVIGAQRKKNGWIKNEGVSLKQEDVAVAILVSKAMEEKDPEKKKEKIAAIINNTAFQNSVFIPELHEMFSVERVSQVEAVSDST